MVWREGIDVPRRPLEWSATTVPRAAKLQGIELLHGPDASPMWCVVQAVRVISAQRAFAPRKRRTTPCNRNGVAPHVLRPPGYGSGREVIGRPPSCAYGRRSGPARRPRPRVPCARGGLRPLQRRRARRPGPLARQPDSGFRHADAGHRFWLRDSASPECCPCCRSLSATCCSAAPSWASSRASRPSTEPGHLLAGLVLLMARPFAVGTHIRVRSGRS